MMKIKSNKPVHVIGGGLAGSETAWFLARHGVRVLLYEMKPVQFSPAHKLEGFAELVCSNSLGSMNENSAPKILKDEMIRLGSIVLEAAQIAAVPAGNALGVNREIMSEHVTKRLSAHPNIEIVREEFTTLHPEHITIVATGPLTSDKLTEELSKYVDTDTLYFYDSISPIVDADSIDYSKTFFASRYDESQDDYLNCPLTKEQYFAFVNDIQNAEKVPVRSFEAMKCFEACMPIEVLAERGPKTLAFGPMKPVGLTDPATGRRPFAVVQLRRENFPTTMYNMVGFQTRMKWGDQKRVFRTIPGLENAEFVRMGSMHRNTYIDSPRLLGPDLFLKQQPNIGFAGQITGVEGYTESAAIGILAGLSSLCKVEGSSFVPPPSTTAMGALLRFITSPGEKKTFAPMNINFGLLPTLSTDSRMDKGEKRIYLTKRAQQDFDDWLVNSSLYGSDQNTTSVPSHTTV